MLPKKNRISRKEFRSPNKRGHRLFSDFFSLIAYPTKERRCFSVVVSKKISKSAVTRNILRRRFYSILELYIKKTNTPAMIVVYPKQNAIFCPFPVLKTEVFKLLREVEIIV